MRELEEWILPALRGIPNELEVYCRMFGPLYETLPRQLIHRDTHLGNLLFEDGAFTGWLDFDMCQVNARVHDICYMGACILFDDDNYREENRVRQWRGIFRGMLEGYGGQLPLAENELAAVPHMFVLIELKFAAYYTREGQADTAQRCIDKAQWLFDHFK